MRLMPNVEAMLVELANTDYSGLETHPIEICEKAYKLGWIEKAASGEYYITDVGRKILSIHNRDNVTLLWSNYTWRLAKSLIERKDK